MRKKDSLKEQDEMKATESSLVEEEDGGNPVVAPHKAALEDRAVSFNLGDLEEMPEREKIEMKETIIDSGEYR